MLREVSDFDGALKLISGMTDAVARRSMVKAGRLLLGRRPAQTTALLIRCVASLPHQSSAVYYPPGSSGAAEAELEDCTIEDFIKLFSGEV